MVSSLVSLVEGLGGGVVVEPSLWKRLRQLSGGLEKTEGFHSSVKAASHTLGNPSQPLITR